MVTSNEVSVWRETETSRRQTPAQRWADVVFVASDQLEGAFEALAVAGVAFDREEAARQAADEGLFIGWVGACRIDVFTPSIPFSWEALKTRVSKDIVDLERLLSSLGKRLDAPYVRRWLVETMGEGDDRVVKWDELCSTFWRDPP